MWKIKIILLSSLLFLGACTSLEIETSIAASCRAYSGTIHALAQMRDQLSDSQVRAVTKTIEVVPDLCRQAANDELTDVPSALAKVNAAVVKMLAIEKEVK